MISTRTSPPTSRRRSLKFLFFTTTLVSTLLFTAIYVVNEPNSSLFYEGKSFLNSLKFDLSLFHFRPKTPIILIWTPYFSRENWLPKYEDLRCSSSCLVSYNRSVLNSSDAIVFHLRDVKPTDLPRWRTKDQVWVLFNKEAPPHTPVDQIAALQSLINWTVTYRRDSDIYSPYGAIVKRSTHLAPVTPKGTFPSNEAFVCWIVSHCVTLSRRENYVRQLKRYIPVSVYGVCGERSCPTQNVYKCYAELSKHCKFYLSFENAICDDYATEKLYYAMRSGMVPVVMGGEDYSKALPENSYINVAFYKDPNDLATLLWQLHKNEDEYKAYQEWKNYYEVKNTSFLWMCDLCEKLHHTQQNGKEEIPHKRLDTWWFNSASCYSWEQYFLF